MTITEKISWSDNMLVGYTPMDDEHHAFVDMIERMQSATADELPPLLDQFSQIAHAHFESENKMMEETQFPPRQCHIDEHMAVLKSVAEVQELLAEGQLHIGASLVDELAKWFPGHVTHLDSALSHWMCKKQLGGKPVVIKRSLNLQHDK
jgi:hypothetical protein